MKNTLEELQSHQQVAKDRLMGTMTFEQKMLLHDYVLATIHLTHKEKTDIISEFAKSLHERI